MNYSYKIKKLENKRGFFCELEISVSRIESSEHVLYYKESDGKWVNSFQFAIDYFKHITRNPLSGYMITVVNFKTNAIDTTPVLAFFSFVKCLQNCFGVEIHDFEINFDDSSIKLFH